MPIPSFSEWSKSPTIIEESGSRPSNRWVEAVEGAEKAGIDLQERISKIRMGMGGRNGHLSRAMEHAREATAALGEWLEEAKETVQESGSDESLMRILKDAVSALKGDDHRLGMFKEDWDEAMKKVDSNPRWYSGKQLYDLIEGVLSDYELEHLLTKHKIEEASSAN